MVYEYVKYPDETLVTFSDIRKKENGDKYIRVSFERPGKNGFDTVVFELPSYNIIEKAGSYSEQEIDFFKQVVEHSAAYFFEVACEGGIESA